MGQNLNTSSQPTTIPRPSQPVAQYQALNKSNLFNNLNSQKHSTVPVGSDAGAMGKFNHPLTDSRDKLIQTESKDAMSLGSGSSLHGSVKRKVERQYPKYSQQEDKWSWGSLKGQHAAANREPTSPPEVKNKFFGTSTHTTSKKKEVFDLDSLLSEMDTTASKGER